MSKTITITCGSDKEINENYVRATSGGLKPFHLTSIEANGFKKYRITGVKGLFYSKKDILTRSSDILDKTAARKNVSVIVKEGINLIAYVDGSFNQATGVYGSGVVILDGNEVISTSKTKGSSMNEMRNVAGEIVAAMTAVNIADELMADSLLICYDYEGIEKWATGAWNAKKEYTQRYRDYMRAAMSKMRISFMHVKAHSNIRYNEMADDLAGEAAGIVSFNDMVIGYAVHDNHLTAKVLEEQYEVSHKCIEMISEFYKKDKKAFGDYLKLKACGLDRLSGMYGRESFETLLSTESLDFIDKTVPDGASRNYARRWAVRGLNTDDAIKKMLVDAEISARFER